MISGGPLEPRPAGGAIVPTSGGGVVAAWLHRHKPTTRRTYTSHITTIGQWAAHTIPHLHGLHPHDAAAAALLTPTRAPAVLTLETHLTWARDTRGLSAATIAGRRAAAASLITYARDQLELITWALAPTDAPVGRPALIRDTRGPTITDVTTVLTTLTNTADTGAPAATRAARDTAIIWLAVGSGLRRSEITGLDIADLDLPGGRILILGKGRAAKEWRTIPEPTTAALSRWLTARATWVRTRGLPATPAVFIGVSTSPTAGRINPSTVYKLVRRAARTAGVDPRAWRPHGLRHTAITAAVEATNGNAFDTQKFSRHATSELVDRYVDARTDTAGEVSAQVAAMFTTPEGGETPNPPTP